MHPESGEMDGAMSGVAIGRNGAGGAGVGTVELHVAKEDEESANSGVGGGNGARGGRSGGAGDGGNGSGKNEAAKSCLMRDVCSVAVGNVIRKAPCFEPHAPETTTDDDFLDFLFAHCPHFFGGDDELAHPLCCSPSQHDAIDRLVQQLDYIARGCPSCAHNAKVYFCNLFCAPDQRRFVRIEQRVKRSVTNVSFYLDAAYAATFFSSCRDVRLFGGYLLDQSFMCGEWRRANCTPQRLFTTLGEIDQMPLVINAVVADGVVERGGRKFAPMRPDVYDCDQAPPGAATCDCDNCEKLEKCEARGEQRAKEEALAKEAAAKKKNGSTASWPALHLLVTAATVATSGWFTSALSC